MNNAEARFNNSLRPRKPEGSLGRTAQDGHLDSHTAPELWAWCQWGLSGSARHHTYGSWKGLSGLHTRWPFHAKTLVLSSFSSSRLYCRRSSIVSSAAIVDQRSGSAGERGSQKGGAHFQQSKRLWQLIVGNKPWISQWETQYEWWWENVCARH